MYSCKTKVANACYVLLLLRRHMCYEFISISLISKASNEVEFQVESRRQKICWALPITIEPPPSISLYETWGLRRSVKEDDKKKSHC